MKQKRFLLLTLLFAVVNIATMRGFVVTNSDGVSINYSVISYTDYTCMVVASNSYSPYSGKVVIPESVIFSGQTYTVKEIASGAFKNCTGLTEVEIPTSVTTIGSNAFYGCSSLTSFTGMLASEDNRCIIIGGELKSFASVGLTSYSIPNSVTSIGEQAFYDCSGLTSVEIPNSVTTIGNSAFLDCSGLTSVEIPNSVTTIGNSAFASCYGLTSVVIGNSVSTIENLAFLGCYRLTSVEIPTSVTTIGERAFEDCSGLTSVEIPSSVTTIGYNAFSKCESLTSFTGKFASEDSRCLIVDGELNSFAPAGLTSYSIPNSVTSIGEQAFSGCSSLRTLDITNSVTSIGNSAFWNCELLYPIVIPNSVTSIGKWAFEGCSSVIYLYGEVSDYEIFSGFFGTVISYESKREEITSSEGWSSDYATFVPLKENISISEIGLATFSTMGGLDLTGNVDVAAYKASVDGNRVVLERVDKVAPYEGVLLRSLNGEAFSDEILSAYVDEPNEGNAFVGTVKETIVEATNGGTTNYVLGSKGGNVGFYRANSTTVGAGKAYLPVPNGAANVKGFRIEFSDDDATGIVEMLGDTDMDSEGYYDLSGRKAGMLKNGMYVKNGKKVYIINK